MNNNIEKLAGRFREIIEKVASDAAKVNAEAVEEACRAMAREVFHGACEGSVPCERVDEAAEPEETHGWRLGALEDGPVGMMNKPISFCAPSEPSKESQEDADVVFALISVASKVREIYGEKSDKIIRSLRRRYGV